MFTDIQYDSPLPSEDDDLMMRTLNHDTHKGALLSDHLLRPAGNDELYTIRNLGPSAQPIVSSSSVRATYAIASRVRPLPVTTISTPFELPVTRGALSLLPYQ
jgi:hypothetical protein